MRHPVAVLFLLFAACDAHADLREIPRSAARAMAEVEATRDDMQFDTHGNVSEALQELMRLRFAATPALLGAIDRLKGVPGRSQTRNALALTLGFIRDPAAIAWLESQSPGDLEFHEAYWLGWTRSGPHMGAWPWLIERHRWLAYWWRALDKAPTPEIRVRILSLLATFDDGSVLEKMHVRMATAGDPREMLVIAAYLDAHGAKYDEQRLRNAIAAMSKAPEDVDFVASVAYHFHHPAFVPYLIEHADVTMWYSPGTRPAQLPLERITYRQDVEGKAAWQAWYAQHGREPRSRWREAALAPFRELLHRDRKAAARWFEKGVYVLAEIDLLDFVQTHIEPHPEFRSHLAGWVNLTYAPLLRSRLQPLAQRLVRRPELLEAWALDLLRELHFVPGEPSVVWGDEVWRANSAL